MQVNEILQQVPFFKALSEADIEQIVKKLDFKSYEPNQAICRINEPGDKMFIIISGRVKICIAGSGDEEQEVAQLDAGNYFGEMALLTDEPRTASVYTTENAEMFILNKKEFDEILDQFPIIQIELGKIMSQRLRQNLSKAMEMTKKAAEKNIEQKSASGKLSAEKSVVDVMGFCDQKGLTGDVIIVGPNGEKASISFDSGQIIKMAAGSLEDDEALDEMITWESGTFTIQPKEVSFDELVGDDVVDTPDAVKEEDYILVVSNSLVVRKLLERKLAEMKKTVKSGKNISSTMSTLDHSIPKYIVADLKFDDGNAKNLSEQVRERSSNVKMILISDGKVAADIQSVVGSDDNIKLTNSHDISEVVSLINSF